jgi:hypothetical protein
LPIVFKLTEGIKSEIIFAMENQNDFAFIDIETGEVVYPDTENFESEDASEPDFDDASRWASLPEWSSFDGFKMMEDFASDVVDYRLQKSLQEVLKQRRGVFRLFKEALKVDPGAESLFMRYKDDKMSERIRIWYDELCQSRRLDNIEDDFASNSETSSLIEGALPLTVCEIGEKRGAALLAEFRMNSAASPIDLASTKAARLLSLDRLIAEVGRVPGLRFHEVCLNEKSSESLLGFESTVGFCVSMPASVDGHDVLNVLLLAVFSGFEPVQAGQRLIECLQRDVEAIFFEDAPGENTVFNILGKKSITEYPLRAFVLKGLR